jgi:hypothetical protein
MAPEGGYNGQKITDVVNIGIGGSDLVRGDITWQSHDQGCVCRVLIWSRRHSSLTIGKDRGYITCPTLTELTSWKHWGNCLLQLLYSSLLLKPSLHWRQLPMLQAKEESAVAKHFVALSTNVGKDHGYITCPTLTELTSWKHWGNCLLQPLYSQPSNGSWRRLKRNQL